MTILNRQQILKADDRKTMTVKVPEWGGEVIVTTISGTDKDAFEFSLVTMKDGASPKNVRAKLLVSACVDEKGQPLFTRNDIVALGKKSAIALDRVFDAAQRLNAVTEEDVEELAKN